MYMYLRMYVHIPTIMYVHALSRNERDSAMAKVATKFTKEGDLFLGQKIIEVRRVGASQEVWFKLGENTPSRSSAEQYLCPVKLSSLSLHREANGERSRCVWAHQGEHLHYCGGRIVCSFPPSVHQAS